MFVRSIRQLMAKLIKVVRKWVGGGSGPEFRVSSGWCRVGSLHLWVGLGRVNKVGPTSNSELVDFTHPT